MSEYEHNTEHGQTKEHSSQGNNATSNTVLGKVDSAFQKIIAYIGKQISIFVAFLFFLFTAGTVFGAIVAVKFSGMVLPFILAPAIMGLIAYYNRTVAMILFAALIILFMT